jgi:hypothetical protein
MVISPAVTFVRNDRFGCAAGHYNPPDTSPLATWSKHKDLSATGKDMSVEDVASPVSLGMNLKDLTIAQRDALRHQLNEMDQCEHVCMHGPGHQSDTKCEVRGKHTEHYIDVPSGQFSWADEDETKVKGRVWKRGKDGKRLYDKKGLPVYGKSYEKSIYCAPYFG